MKRSVVIAHPRRRRARWPACRWLRLPAFYESILYLVLHWVLLATSWNILSGYSGYFSFGHGAFFGVGVYTTAVLAAKFDWPFLATLPVAAAVAAALGVALGAVVFRVRSVRGELFALLTLAVTFVVATIVLNTPIDGGPGIYLSAVPVPRARRPRSRARFYLLALAGAVATLLIAYTVQHSRLGVGLFAIHDDEDVAEVMGVPTFRYKLVALALSCALAGLAGGVHALFISYVTTGETFTITVPLTVVLMSVLGGTRHWAGPAVGATAITALLYAFTTGDIALVGKATTGAVLIAVILFMPQGIVPRLLQRRMRAPAAAASSAPAEQAPMAAQQPVPAPRPAATPPRSTAPSPSGELLLRTRALAKSFIGVQALAGVDVEVRRGEILGLLGPNGSGKSTFINVVSGHYAASAGGIQFEGREIAHLAAHRIAHAGIARTYQIPRPFAHLSVRENVALAAMFGGAGLSASQARREADHWLGFTGLAAKADALPDELNLHQRKFLELTRALASRPRLVLLDEVLSGLTPAEIDEAIALIRRIRDDGTTIVFVEHVMRAVMALSDRVVVFHHGQVLAEGPAGRGDAAARRGGGLPGSGACCESLTSSGLRRRARAVGRVDRDASRRAALRRRAQQRRQDDADQHHRRAVARARRHDSVRRPRHHAAAAAPLLRRGHRDRARGAAAVRHHERAREPRARQPACALARAALELARACAGAVPGIEGQTARSSGLAVRRPAADGGDGRALMSRPKLLLLDEPSLGLSPLVVQDLFAAFRRISAEGMTMLLVEQNVAIAMQIAQRVYVLEEGRIVGRGHPRGADVAPRDPARLPRQRPRRGQRAASNAR